MVLSQITLGIVILVILVLLNAIPKFGKLVSNFFLLTLFLFIQANISGAQGTFYTIMLLSIFIFNIFDLAAKDVQQIKFGTLAFKGLGISAVSIVVGIAIWLGIRFLSGGATTAIIGVPTTLAVSGAFVNALNPAALGALGFIENRFFFGILNVMTKFFPMIPLVGFFFALPFLSLLLPMLMTALLFALFHGTLLGTAFTIFAFLTFTLWILVFQSPLGEEPTSISHYLHNFTVGLSRTLSI